MASCPRCERVNDQDSRFCKHCGAFLRGIGGGDPAPSGSAPAPASPPDARRASPVDDDTMIMRLFDERPEEAVIRRASIWLLDPTGEHVARSCELKDETTVIGRQADATICLPSSTVSRHHAHIRRDGAQYFLRDLNSTNGTLLNREPVIGEELLHDRDEIGVGIYRLIFRYS